MRRAAAGRGAALSAGDCCLAKRPPVADHPAFAMPRCWTTPGYVALLTAWTAQLNEAASRSYPLTSMQKGILFHALLRPDAGLYVQQVVVTLDGHPNLSVLRQAWNEVLAHHSVLAHDVPLEGTRRAGSAGRRPVGHAMGGRRLARQERGAVLCGARPVSRRRFVRLGFSLTTAPTAACPDVGAAGELHDGLDAPSHPARRPG